MKSSFYVRDKQTLSNRGLHTLTNKHLNLHSLTVVKKHVGLHTLINKPLTNRGLHTLANKHLDLHTLIVVNTVVNKHLGLTANAHKQTLTYQRSAHALQGPLGPSLVFARVFSNRC
jgi:hypothetical protein